MRGSLIFPCMVLLLSAFRVAAYEDSPVEAGRAVAALMSEYEVAARKTLPHFRKSFETAGDREFYVVTKIYEGEYFEQVFVRVRAIEKERFLGEIASRPMGKMDFSYGDKRVVKVGEVADWVIVNPDGSEEGNLQGKALDLLQVGAAAVIIRVDVADGRYGKVKAESVINPKTRQDVSAIVPEKVLRSAEQYIAKLYDSKVPVSDEHVYTYVVVTFPGWELVEVEDKP